MEIKEFQKTVWDYYGANRRAMPWRDVITPYRVFVSEVMLQQTQVARVMEKFSQFIKQFPSFRALAAAPLNELLSVWQGMGYNRRALYLKKAAEVVVLDYRSRLPRNPEELEKLPGIGPATARSIAAFAWNSPEVFIETNIRAVFLHHFFVGRSSVSDSQLLPFVEQTLDRENPREWYYALMDYGTMLKKTNKNPSRASAHHIKQSKFEGSVRQTRGKIVKILSAEKTSYTDAALAKRAAESAVKINAALQGLVRDGLVRKIGAKFSIF
ncbi:MAG: A/G-specific adenine glycosylase [bacterium]|nr:A/G-specific adenine glycosylase [bacterium]